VTEEERVADELLLESYQTVEPRPPRRAEEIINQKKGNPR
jgi:hypothetical protein